MSEFQGPLNAHEGELNAHWVNPGSEAQRQQMIMNEAGQYLQVEKNKSPENKDVYKEGATLVPATQDRAFEALLSGEEIFVEEKHGVLRPASREAVMPKVTEQAVQPVRQEQGYPMAKSA